MDALARERAKACTRALVERGVPRPRLRIVYHGLNGQRGVEFIPRSVASSRLHAEIVPPPMPDDDGGDDGHVALLGATAADRRAGQPMDQPSFYMHPDTGELIERGEMPGEDDTAGTLSPPGGTYTRGGGGGDDDDDSYGYEPEPLLPPGYRESMEAQRTQEEAEASARVGRQYQRIEGGVVTMDVL